MKPGLRKTRRARRFMNKGEPEAVQYIAREAARRYGPIEPGLPEKLQRNIRRNFHVTVSRETILRLAEHYKEMYTRASSLLPAYVGPRTGRYVDPADVKISQFVAALRKRYAKESKPVVEMIAWYVVHYEYLR